MFKKILTYSLLSLVGMVGFLGVSLSGVDTISSTTSYRVSIGSETFASCVSESDGTRSGVDCPDGIEKQSAAKTQDADMKKMLNSLVAGLNIILDLLTILVSPAIMLAGWLMSPDWTSGDLFGIRPVLHALWVTVSNIVYFVYAVLLIFIALATIFNSQNYGYKQLLPKLALGVILVPLTWWFVQFIISLSTLVTASAISVPMETLSKYSQADSFWNAKSIPKKIEYENTKMYSAGTEVTGKTILCNENGKDTNCISPKEFTETSGGMYSPLLVYTFSVFKFQNVKKINTITDGVFAITDIIHQGIIGVLMFVVYGLLVLALIFMLFMRAVKLWFYAIFSPLFTIKYVLGDKGFGEADKDGSFKITEFIGLAFVPAVVSLALSFGLIIISVMHSPMNSGSSNPNNTCTGQGDTQECTLIIMGNGANKITSSTEVAGNIKKSVTTLKIGGLEYKFKGSVTGGPTIVSGLSSALGATGNLFGRIILDIIALIFIWIAFMAGKGVSKAAGKAIEPFEAMGKKIGSLGASLPKYAPIPGIGVSMSGANQLISGVESKISANSTDRANESNLGKILGMDKKASGESKVRADNTVNAINGKDFKGASEQLKLAVTSLQKDTTNSKEVKEEIAKIADSLRGLDPKDRREILNKAGISLDATNAFERLLEENGKDTKIDKNSLKVNGFQTAILGASTPSGGINNSSAGFTATKVEGGKATDDTIMNVRLGDITTSVNVTQKKVEDTFSNIEKLKELMKTLTEGEMLSKLPDNLNLDTKKAIITKMREVGEFKKKI